MRRHTALAAVLALSSVSVSAAELAECVTIQDDAVRLFCYDRVAGHAGAAPATTTPSRTAPAAPATDIAVDAAPAVAAPPAPATPEPATEPAKTPAKRIESRIVGTFEGWSAGTRFTLENGETWEAVGAGTHYSKSESPKVVIERDFIGQNLMSVEGVKSRAIVRRVDG